MMGLMHFMKAGSLTAYARSKNVPMPGLSVAVAGILMLLGGFGILFWMYIEWAVLALALFLVPVSFKMHNFWAIKDPQDRMAQMSNFMKNMAFLGAALMFLSI